MIQRSRRVLATLRLGKYDIVELITPCKNQPAFLRLNQDLYFLELEFLKILGHQ